jgi:hypothetical protein
LRSNGARTKRAAHGAGPVSPPIADISNCHPSSGCAQDRSPANLELLKSPNLTEIVRHFDGFVRLFFDALWPPAAGLPATSPSEVTEPPWQTTLLAPQFSASALLPAAVCAMDIFVDGQHRRQCLAMSDRLTSPSPARFLEPRPRPSFWLQRCNTLPRCTVAVPPHIHRSRRGEARSSHPFHSTNGLALARGAGL